MNASTDVETAVQPFGALLDTLLVRFAEDALFPVAATDIERKEAILAAYERGDLTRRQTDTLVAAFRLEAA